MIILMILSPWVLIEALLLALGIWWCREMLPRWRDDLRRLREPGDLSDLGGVFNRSSTNVGTRTFMGSHADECERDERVCSSSHWIFPISARSVGVRLSPSSTLV